MRPVAYGPHWPRQPLWTSPAPIGLAYPHRLRLLPCRGGSLASELVLGFGLRLWQSAWSFPFLSLSYISLLFSFLSIGRQFFFFFSPLSSHVNINSRSKNFNTELNNRATDQGLISSTDKAAMQKTPQKPTPSRNYKETTVSSSQQREIHKFDAPIKSTN